MSYREQLEGLASRTKNPDKRAGYESELACPPIPPELMYLWKLYRRLANRRGSNGFSQNPISWPEIDAFVRNAKVLLAPWEIEVIEEIDDIDRSEQAKAANPNAIKPEDS